MKHAFSIRLLLAGAALTLAALPLSAQPAPNRLPRNLFPPSLLPAPQLTPEEQATIDRALSDLRSENSEFRAGAVMLLGKYPTTAAQNAVIAALEDPSVRVRRAALVSVMEWSRGAPPEAVVPVLRLIGDDDVELRRTASAAIQAMMTVRRAMQVMRPDNEQELPDDLQQTLADAYLDEDVIVRRNMLTNYFFLNLRLPSETLLALMNDEDAQVRLEAVGLAARYADPQAFNDAALIWIEDGTRMERLRLTREVALRPTTGQLELLRRLAQDEDDEIAAEALLGRYQQLGTDAIFDQLYERLLDGRLKQNQGLRFIQALRFYPDEIPSHVGALAQLEDPFLRREVADLFFDMGFAPRRPEQVKQFLADPSQEVRAVALKHYERRTQEVSNELLAIMLASDHPDVRLSLAYITGSLEDVATAEPILMDLLLDEHTAIRQQVLREIAQRRLDGWQDILTVSLDDEDPVIQRQAIDSIIRQRMPGAAEALSAYLEQQPDSPLAPLIRIYLKNPPQPRQPQEVPR